MPTWYSGALKVGRMSKLLQSLTLTKSYKRVTDKLSCVEQSWRKTVFTLPTFFSSFPSPLLLYICVLMLHSAPLLHVRWPLVPSVRLELLGVQALAPLSSVSSQFCKFYALSLATFVPNALSKVSFSLTTS